MKALRFDGLGFLFIVVWASGYVVGALATQVMPPLTITLWRFVVAAAVLTVLGVVRRERWPRGRQLLLTAAVGVPMFALQFGGLYTALGDGMPAGTTALIACTSPLVVAVVGRIGGWESLTTRQWVGVGLGVLAVAVTLSDRVGRPPGPAAVGWALLGLTGLVVGSLGQSRLSRDVGPTATAGVQVAAAAVVLAVWAPSRASIAVPLTAQALGSLGWLALGTGVVAPLLLLTLIRRRGATGATSLLFVVPAVTVLAQGPILATPISIVTILGMIIGAAALLLARRTTKRPDLSASPVEAEEAIHAASR